MRTFLIFVDLPVHYEFQVDSWPVFDVGVEINFDLKLKDPKNTKRMKHIVGPYRVKSRRMNFESEGPRSGLSQYIELISSFGRR